MWQKNCFPFVETIYEEQNRLFLICAYFGRYVERTGQIHRIQKEVDDSSFCKYLFRHIFKISLIIKLVLFLCRSGCWRLVSSGPIVWRKSYYVPVEGEKSLSFQCGLVFSLRASWPARCTVYPMNTRYYVLPVDRSWTRCSSSSGPTTTQRKRGMPGRYVATTMLCIIGRKKPIVLCNPHQPERTVLYYVLPMLHRE